MINPKIRFKRDDGSEYPVIIYKLFGEIASYRRGSFPQPYGNPEWYDDENGRPFIQVADVNDNMSVNSSTKRHISKIAEGKSVFVPKGSLIITLQGTIGRVAITDYDAYLDRTLLYVNDVDSEVSVEYLKRILYVVFKEEQKKADGGTIKTITKDTLTNFKIPIPCLEEQQKIADFLSSVDDIISASEAEVKNLEEQKKGVMQKIFSQEVRFKADDGSEYPEWEKNRLIDILAQPISDGPHETPPLVEYGIPFISGEAINGNRIDFSKARGFISEEYDEYCRKKFSPQKYDVFVVKSGSIGKVAIADTDIKFNIWSPLAAIRAKEVTTSWFVFHWFQWSETQKQLVRKQGKGAQPNVGMRQMEQLAINVPCLEEQQKIADFLSTFDEAIEQSKKELEKWKELKKGLLQQMFV